jgi:hypothetical protein
MRRDDDDDDEEEEVFDRSGTWRRAWRRVARRAGAWASRLHGGTM